MKTKLFNVLTIALLVYGGVSVGYTALPVEYQEMIPYYNEVIAIVSGGSAGLIGSAGLYFKNVLAKNNIQIDNKVDVMTEQFMKIAGDYKTLKLAYDEVRSAYNDLNKTNKSIVELVKADLNAKLSNPLIDEQVKKVIEGVLSENS